MRTSVLAIAAVLAACSSGEQQTAGAEPQATGAAAAPSVERRAPNKKDASPAFAGQTRAPAATSVGVSVQEIASGIDEPWGMALLPGGGALVTARGGKLWRVTPDGAKAEVAGAPKVDARDQGGLLDVSLAPDFATSRSVYFCIAEPRGSNTNGTSLVRGALSADATRIENASIIFRQEPAWASTKHFGCNIEWARDGHLFLALGERSNREPRELSQDLSGHLGKVVRLTADGKPAPGNPFLGQANARPEIWSYGHRNVQGAAIHPETGELWTVEHGPRGGDELNVAEAGKNYGWPVISYGIEYVGGPINSGATARDGLEQPVYYWDPVIAPGDMTFYTGDLFPWKGDLLVAGLSAKLVRLDLDGRKVVGEEWLLDDVGRIRDVDQAPDGSLWVITDEGDGQVLRLTPAR
jgi:aldose sugar dehydrogenase